MAILANRVRTKSFFVEIAKFSFFSLKKFFILVLLLSSCGLLYFEPPRIVPKFFTEATGNILSVGTLIYQESIVKVKNFADRFVYLIDLETENLKLKSEIAALKEEFVSMAIVKSENNSLRSILNVAAISQNHYIAAKIISLSLSPFSSSAILKAGSKEGVKVDDIVKADGGLLGRVMEVSDHYSTIMLINDYNSRIPVITDSSKERGIIAKQGDHLKMIYTSENHQIKPGEIVYTSGDGKIYPHGLKVAMVDKVTDEGIFIKMSANINNIEFVIVESKQQLTD